MTVIRHIRATYDGTTVPASGSEGRDSQLLMFAITLTQAIPAGTLNQRIFEWTGANKLLTVFAFTMITTNGDIIPTNNLGTTRVNLTTNPATGNKCIVIGVATNGVPIPANTVVYAAIEVGIEAY